MKNNFMTYFFGIIVLFVGAYYADEIITGRSKEIHPSRAEVNRIQEIRTYAWHLGKSSASMTRSDTQELAELQNKYEPNIQNKTIELTCKTDSYSDQQHIGGMRCVTLHSDDVVVYSTFSNPTKTIDTYKSDIFKIKGEITGIKLKNVKTIGISTNTVAPNPVDMFAIIIYVNGDPILMNK